MHKNSEILWVPVVYKTKQTLNLEYKLSSVKIV